MSVPCANLLLPIHPECCLILISAEKQVISEACATHLMNANKPSVCVCVCVCVCVVVVDIFPRYFGLVL